MSTQPISEAPSRVRRGALDRAGVVAAALEVADREGLSGVTMARVAQAAGTSPMSLYRHLRDKKDLLEAVADLALSELPAIAQDDRPWRVRLEEFALASRQNALRHPALVEIILDNDVYGRSANAVRQGIIDLLREAGFDDASAVRGFMTVRNHVIGALAWEISRFRQGSDGFVRQVVGSYVRRGTPADSPLWHFGDVVTDDPEAQFVFSVGCLLDGFDAALARRRTRARQK